MTLQEHLKQMEKQVLAPYPNCKVRLYNRMAQTPEEARAGFKNPYVVWSERPDGVGDAQPTEAGMPRHVTNIMDYSSSLHELGHVATWVPNFDCNRIDIESILTGQTQRTMGPEAVEAEAAASVWAIDHCLPNVRTKVIDFLWGALETYIDGGKRGVFGYPQKKGENWLKMEQLHKEATA